jgi:hypothetical protein
LQSCATLAKCMKLREKYQSAHPTPPQDIIPRPELKSILSTPLSPIKTNKQGKAVFRRRLDPEYDVFSRPVPSAMQGVSYSMEEGVFHSYRTTTLSRPAEPPALDLNCPSPPDLGPSDPQQAPTTQTVTEQMYSCIPFSEFVADFGYLRRMISAGPVKSYAFKRLKLLESRFKLHILLNDNRELEATKSVPHRDFYNVRKVSAASRLDSYPTTCRLCVNIIIVI